MSRQYHFSYQFQPVGQGLFASGWIRKWADDQLAFVWVYDCGSSSSQQLIDDGIQRLERSTDPRKQIDLLTLSHFDHDHISGVCRLIERFKIGTLMLPYMPLAQRLILAFEERSGGPDDPITGFYLNPVAHVLALEGPGIGRILFVLPSGADGPAFPEEGQSVNHPKMPDSDDDRPDIDFTEDKPEDGEEVRPLIEAAQNSRGGTRVQFLRRGSSITVRSLWEFVPYNDDPEEEISAEFRERVSRQRDRLLGARDSSDRAGALEQIKRLYDDQFGRSSKDRNVISVFLYSGPLYPSWSRTEFANPWWLYDRHPDSPFLRVWIRSNLADVHSSKQCSIIYSGDGYLDTADRLQRLVGYFRPDRISRTGAFQVMHHGAKANWHEGVAAAIAPLSSVFSSDPYRRWKHPDAEVLRDFWPYGAVQVDQYRDAHFEGLLLGHP